MEPFVCILVPFTEWNPLVAECVEGCLNLNYGSFIVCLLPNERENVPAGVTADPRVAVLPTVLPDISLKRNRGIEAHPQAELYACIDSDAVPHTQWLHNAVIAFHKSGDIGLVGGPDISPEYSDVMRRAVRNALVSLLVGGGRVFMKRMSPSRFTDDLRTANCIIRREVIENIGGFDEDMPVGEDSGLCLRARRHGWKIWFDGGVVVRHHNRRLFLPFLKQKIMTGYGVPNLMSKYPDMPLHAWLLRIAPIAMIFYLSAGCLSYFSGGRIFNAWAVGTGLYICAVMIEALRHSDRIRDVPLTAAAILIGNLGPGIGVLLAACGVKIKLSKFYRNA